MLFAGRCHRSAGAHGGRTRTVGLLDLELQAVSLQEQYAVFTTEPYVCPSVHHFRKAGTWNVDVKGVTEVNGLYPLIIPPRFTQGYVRLFHLISINSDRCDCVSVLRAIQGFAHAGRWPADKLHLKVLGAWVRDSRLLKGGCGCKGVAFYGDCWWTHEPTHVEDSLRARHRHHTGVMTTRDVRAEEDGQLGSCYFIPAVPLAPFWWDHKRDKWRLPGFSLHGSYNYPPN